MRRILIWGAVFIGIAALALAFVLVMLERRTDAGLDAIREAGLPATPEELNEWYPAPDGPNAADIVLDAASRIDDRDWRRIIDIEVSPGAALSDAERDVIDGHIAANGEALALLHTVEFGQPARYPLDFADTTGAWGGRSLFGAKDTVRLLRWEAIHHAEHGRMEPAAQSILQALAVAETLRKAPSQLPQFIRIMMADDAIDALQNALNCGAMDDASLKQIDAAFERMHDPDALFRGLVGERCFVAHASVADYKQSFLSAPAAAPLAYTWDGLMRGDLLTTMNQAVDYARLVPGPRRQAFLDLEIEVMDRWMFTAYRTQFMMPSLSNIPDAFNGYHASLATARLAVAVERYRGAHGKLPTDVDALTPEYLYAIPIDPFDGGPIRFLPVETGYKTYSVFRNLKDDGGTHVSEARRGVRGDADWVFEVRRDDSGEAPNGED